MAELFRYIEQVFAVPDAAGEIDTQSNSSFQTSLRQASSQHQSSDQIRAIAEKFLNENFPQVSDNPVRLADLMRSFARQLRSLASPSQSTVGDLV